MRLLALLAASLLPWYAFGQLSKLNGGDILNAVIRHCVICQHQHVYFLCCSPGWYLFLPDLSHCFYKLIINFPNLLMT